MQAEPDIRQRVAEFIAQHGLLTDVAHLLVGFSGGADSATLLLLLRDLAGPITGIHLHHGLRGAAADADAAWCEEFCASIGVTFERHTLDVPARRRPAESVEEAARRCRLEFWRERAPARTSVALGHQLDDCLEDLLLRLARGANASGLTGLRPLRVLDGVRIVRPLLCVRRAELEAFLRKEGINEWCEDSSNLDTALRRNAVRHEWLADIRRTLGHDAGLVHSLAALRADADFLEACAGRAVAAMDDAAKLRDLHPALLPRVLRLWLREQLGRDFVPARALVTRLRTELQRDLKQPVQIPLERGLALLLDRHGLRLAQPAVALTTRLWRWRERRTLALPETGAGLCAEVLAGEVGLEEFSESGCTEYYDAASLPPVLTVRAWQAGDRVVPFGAASAKKLQDIFVDAHVPRRERAAVPILVAQSEIIWAAGVRRAEFGRAAPGAAQLVRLTYTEPAPAKPESSPSRIRLRRSSH